MYIQSLMNFYSLVFLGMDILWSTQNPSIQHKKPSVPPPPQFKTPPHFNTKTPSVPHPSVPHHKPLSSRSVWN